MNEPITVYGRSINTITAEIRAVAEQATQIVVMSAIRLGGLLTDAKELVAPGEWGIYLENEVNFSHRTANNFMKLYQEYKRDPNSQALANMSYTKAVRLLSLPEADREELLEKHDVPTMSSRELEQVIKERDEAKAAKEAVDAENRNLQQALLDAEQRAANAKSAEDAWTAEVEKLKQAKQEAESQRDKVRGQMDYLKQHPEIPKKVKDKLIADAKAEGAKEAAADFEKRLAEAQNNINAATAAKAAAEKDAQDARQKLEASQKTAQLSSQEASNFMFLFSQIQEDLNKLNGYRLKVKASNPELGNKLTAALQDMLDSQRRAVN